MPDAPDPFVTLREYIERIFDERQRTLELTASALSHRLDLLNALREDVIRDRELFVQKSVFASTQEEMIRRLNKVEQAQSRIIGVAATLVVTAGLVGAFLGTMLSHLWK